MNQPEQQSQPEAKVEVVEQELYAKHKKVYARETPGKFNNLRWALVFLTQIIFYFGPWLQWNGRQALLFDLAERKFYLFGLVLWPQDVIYLSVLLLLSAFGLFLFTAVAGRLFCGYACPQTVYTEIFMWIENRIEGDRNARIKLDQSPMTATKFRIKSSKFMLWGILSLWTGITFVGYFMPMRDLMHDLLTLTISGWSAFWVFFYSAFCFLQAGFMREQVCKYMCPYARFQGVMFDPDTLIVTYDEGRGEPRGPRRKTDDLKAKGLGECVDCKVCVQVCPTGIDIRNGSQYQCINCGLCIDACDQVMLKTGAAPGLIRFMSEEEHQGTAPRPGMRQRPRVLIYAALLLVTTLLMAWTLQTRPTLRAEILRDRGALLRESPEGRIENAYTVKILNLAEQPRRVHLTVSGLPGLALVGRSDWPLEPSSILVLSVTVAAPAEGPLRGSQPIRFHVQDDDGSEPISENSTFILP